MSAQQTPTWRDLQDLVAGVVDAQLASGAGMSADRSALDEVMALHAEVAEAGREHGWETPASPSAVARTAAVRARAAGISGPHADYRAPVGDQFDTATDALAGRGIEGFDELPEALRMRMTQAAVDALEEAPVDPDPAGSGPGAGAGAGD